MNWTTRRAAVCLTALLTGGAVMAQDSPAGAPGGGRGRADSGNSRSFPQRAPVPPAVLAQGKSIYGVNCNFCHGSDARGGEGGPNLLRSELVLEDRKGELIGGVVRNGRPDAGMPKFDMTDQQIEEMSAFIHSFPVDNRDPARFPPPSILVGDAKAGEVSFRARCSSCHSTTGDLKGIASRIIDPKTLQDTFIMPGAGGGGGRGGPKLALKVPPVTVTVTLPDGRKAEGRLARIDDFMVSLIGADDMSRTYRRDGDVPAVQIHDPLQPHKDLLTVYTDKEIHNLTAYLVTLK